MSSLEKFKRIAAAAVVASFLLGSYWLWQNAATEPESQTLRERADGVDSRTDATRPIEIPELPARPSQGFVGSAACAECHADIAESYRTHPMAQSLAKAVEASPIETFGEPSQFSPPTAPHHSTRYQYRAERTETEVVHHEICTDRQGETIYDLAVPVHYAMGSGQRGRSYLVNRGGVLHMSPMTWYSQRGRWDLSPGYATENLHFERQIVDGCVSCHVGRTANVVDAHNRFETIPFLEEAIGCERCHGPGKDHIALHERGMTDDESDPIVNPDDLEPSLRDSVCFQCHLQGEERIVRYGRTDFDFRPGDDVTDIWTVFVRGTRVAGNQTTEAVSQVEQMLHSACYIESDGRMGCISCHDPHSSPSAEDRIAFYRSRCLECHGPGQTNCRVPVEERTAFHAEDSCIDCHMPAIKAHDVPHTSQTDHRILRRPLARGTPKAPPAELKIFRTAGREIPRPELQRAEGLILVRYAEKDRNGIMAEQAIPLLKPWSRAAPHDAAVMEALGAAYWLTRDLDGARSTWERGLQETPEDERLLRRMLLLCHETGLLKRGVQYGERLVAVNPWDHEYHGRLAHMLGQLGRLSEGIPAAVRAVELNPSAFQIHGWLAEVYAHTGDSEAAKRHRRLYRKLAPR